MKSIKISLLVLYLIGVLNIPVLVHHCAMTDSISVGLCEICIQPEESSCCEDSESLTVKEKFNSPFDGCCSSEISNSPIDTQIFNNVQIAKFIELTALVVHLQYDTISELPVFKITEEGPHLRHSSPDYLWNKTLLI